MKQVRFEESEVPYQTLARFGLTQEKIEDLPMWALEDIGQGRRSPLLPIQVNNDEWKSHSTLPLLATQNYPFWLKYD